MVWINLVIYYWCLYTAALLAPASHNVLPRSAASSAPPRHAPVDNAMSQRVHAYQGPSYAGFSEHVRHNEQHMQSNTAALQSRQGLMASGGKASTSRDYPEAEGSRAYKGRHHSLHKQYSQLRQGGWEEEDDFKDDMRDDLDEEL
jgi:hypothetical protein